MNDSITLRPVSVAKPTRFYMKGVGLLPNAYNIEHNSPDGVVRAIRIDSFGQSSEHPDLQR